MLTSSICRPMLYFSVKCDSWLLRKLIPLGPRLAKYLTRLNETFYTKKAKPVTAYTKKGLASPTRKGKGVGITII